MLVCITIMVCIALCLILFIHLTFSHKSDKLYGGQANIIEPIKYETLREDMYLYIHIGNYSNGNMIITNHHHFPINHGNPPTLYIHGAPLYSAVVKYNENKKSNAIYGVVKIDRGRTICTMKASVYNPQLDNHNMTIETVRHVLYPNSKVDFSFIPDTLNDDYISTIYRHSNLSVETPDLDIIHRLLQNYTNEPIISFIFNKLNGESSRKLIVTKYTNGWSVSMKYKNNNSVPVPNTTLLAFLEEIETHNHYPPLDNNDIGKLEYVENNLMDGYDIMKYYANRRIE